jgi:hypothetical protein
MVYPPGDFTPREQSVGREPRDYLAPEAVYPRPNIDTEIGAFSNESQYVQAQYYLYVFQIFAAN